MRYSSHNAMQWTVLALIFILYTILEELTPFQYDNILFESAYRQFAGDSCKFSFAAYGEYINHIRIYDNWRLSNILSPLTTLFFPSKLCFSIIVGFCVAASASMASRLINHGRSVSTTVAVWASMTIFLPWRNNILTGDYALNYVLGTAIALYTHTLCLRNTYTKRTSAVRQAGTIAMAVILGMWHEGFALASAAGLGLWILVRRGRVPWIVYATCITTAVVALIWAGCSHMVARGSNEISDPAWKSNIAGLAFNNILTLILLSAIMLSLCFHTGRKSLGKACKRPEFVVFTGAAAAGTLISAAVVLSGRTAFWPQMCAIVASGAWILILIRDAIRTSAGTRLITASAVVLLCIQGVYAAIYCEISGREYTQATRGMEESETGTFFYDIHFIEDYPLLTAGLPSRWALTEEFTYFCLDNYYYPREHSVVPTALAGSLDSISTHSITSNIEVRRAGTDALFSPSFPSSRHCLLVNPRVTLTDGSVLENHPVFVLRFTGKDGRQYHYLKVMKIPSEQVAEIEFAK